MEKRLLVIVLLPCLFILLLPCAAASRTEGGDADCFSFTAWNGGFAVSGLTETGKSRETLTVPAAHEGLPVLALQEGAFAGSERLTEVRLLESLQFIADGAFRDCPALRGILLYQEDPSQCAVGQGLLTGTDAVVYVPADRYAAYCTHYFWAMYAPWLRKMDEAPRTSPAPSPTMPMKSVTRIRYEGNGGAVRGQDKMNLSREITYAHQRENTLQGTVWFEREGYVMTGWNTEPDGSGLAVGLGSRIDPQTAGALYAQWLPCSPDADFDWETDGGSAVITGYHGQGDICVLPEKHEGLPVRTVRAGAFRGTDCSLLVFSPSLRTVEEGAFQDCGINTLLLFDSLKTVSDACFSTCHGPETLRINAATSPVYSGSYFDTFQDKYDILLSLRGKKKLALSSGSSGRYGYDSALLKQAFPDLEPVNMGVYAFTNALPQLRLILKQMEAGDILLYAPEFDAIPEQFCVSNRLDTGFWAMMEGNYDTVAKLDIGSFSGVFDSLGEYLSIRSRMPGKDYGVSPAHYDDDGNFYAFSTYNQYGDFILPRPNSATDGRLRHNIADYTVNSFPLEILQSLNAALSPFAEKGVSVFFTYTPRNVHSLTEESTPEARQALHQWLKENLAVPVISEIEDSLLPGRYFWLIDSHTGTEGAGIHTQRVIRDLQNALTNASERSPGP